MKKVLLVISALLICIVAEAQYSKSIRMEPVLKTDTTTIGQKIIYPQFKNDEVTIVKINIPPGESTGWHKHAFPVFAYILKGTLTIEVENNKSMRFSENTSFAEVMNTFHNGINKGDEAVVLIAFFMGGKGTELSIHR
jgi:quercetin dioxygenase-like cupin family protein